MEITASFIESEVAVGGPAAIRGFRLQALYALNILLTQKHVKLNLEGHEDLDELDDADAPTNFVQVKALSANLNWSSLGERYIRALEFRAKNEIGDSETVVSFGPVSQELADGLADDGPSRSKLVAKMCKLLKCRKGLAKKALSRLTITRVNPEEIYQEVLQSIRSSPMVSDPRVTVDLLLSWILRLSESRATVSYEDLLARASTISRYCSEIEAHRNHWFTRILPLDCTTGSPSLVRLREEYSAGVAARFEHIVQELDVVRERHLQAIHTSFQTGTSVFFLRGASGQGKSSLAYRYAKDFFPRHLRFELKNCLDTTVIPEIVQAITAQAKLLEESLLILVDVNPRDQLWTLIVRELAELPSVKVLVTVRQDDWNRAAFDPPLNNWKDIELDFAEQDAREFFDTKGQFESRSTVYPCFEDAWIAFGKSGPLLEFAFLIGHAATLRERLAAQVKGLVTADRHSELEIVFLVSLANCCGGRVSVQGLTTAMKLRGTPFFIANLAGEFLVRESDGVVSGLHPVRSTILVELLASLALPSRAEGLAILLPAVADDDLLVYLLNALAGSDYRDWPPLLAALRSYTPKSWNALGACTKALLWAGVKRNIQQNFSLLQEMYSEMGDVLDLVITNLDFGMATKVSPSLDVAFHKNPSRRFDPIRMRWQQYNERWTGAEEVHLPCREWLTSVPLQEVYPPSTPQDWEGLSWFSYWAFQLDISRIRETLASLSLAEWPPEYPLEIGAWTYFTLFLWNIERSELRENLLQRYQRDWQVFDLQISTSNTSARYLVPKRLGRKAFSAIPVRQLGILRALCPQSDAFSLKGFGHRGRDSAKSVDEQLKSGVSRDGLLPPFSVEVNHWFCNLIALPFRPPNWQQYVESALLLRKEISTAFGQVRDALVAHFETGEVLGTLRSELDGESLDLTRLKISQGRYLPTEAIDAFGRVSEASADRHQLEHLFMLGRYSDYIESKKNYLTSAWAFFQQVPWGILSHVATAAPFNLPARLNQIKASLAKHGASGEEFSLSARNLSDAIVRLPELQRQFRNHFKDLCNREELLTLETNETLVTRELYELLLLFESNPHLAYVPDVRQTAQQLARSRIAEMTSAFEKSKTPIPLKQHAKGKADTLLVTYDLPDPLLRRQALPLVVALLRKALGQAESASYGSLLPVVTWRRILTIEKCQGFLLHAVAREIEVRFDPLQSLRYEENVFDYPTVRLEGDDLQQVEHSEIPASSLAPDLMETFLCLVDDLTSMANLEEVPEWKEEVREAVLRYFQERANGSSILLQQTIDLLTEALGPMQQGLDIQDPSLPDKLALFKCLQNFMPALLPPRHEGTSAIIAVDELPDWLKKLNVLIDQGTIDQICGLWERLRLRKASENGNFAFYLDTAQTDEPTTEENTVDPLVLLLEAKQSFESAVFILNRISTAMTDLGAKAEKAGHDVQLANALDPVAKRKLVGQVFHRTTLSIVRFAQLLQSEVTSLDRFSRQAIDSYAKAGELLSAHNSETAEQLAAQIRAELATFVSSASAAAMGVSALQQGITGLPQQTQNLSDAQARAGKVLDELIEVLSWIEAKSLIAAAT